MARKLKIFMSYVDPDQAFKQVLLKQLAILQRQGLIATCDSSLIRDQTNKQQAIQSIIKECQIVLLLLSVDYLASEEISTIELPYILEQMAQGQVRVIPIILQACAWQQVNLIKTLPVLPTNCKPVSSYSDNQEERAQVWADIGQYIAQLVTELQTKLQSKQIHQVDLSHFSQPSTPLIGRFRYLTLLDKTFSDKQMNLISFIAVGGMGKTALVNEWLKRMAPSYNGAKSVFGWSFCGQANELNTPNSSHSFFEQALPFFGYQGPWPSNERDKALCLEQQIRKKPSLLVLDGLQPLQYLDPIQRGQLADIALKILLQQISINGLGSQSLVIITSQHPLVELAHYEAYQEYQLEPLDLGNSTTLLKRFDLHGSPWQFTAASKTFKGHPLALILLGHLLAQWAQGDITQYSQLPVFQEDKSRLENLVLPLLSFYDTACWPIQAPERLFLYLLSLFDRPMNWAEKEVLFQQLEIAQPLARLTESDWRNLLKRLQQQGFLFENTFHQWETHPIIRHYFGQQWYEIDLTTWQMAHHILFQYFQRTNIMEESVYHAVHHGCLAGKYQNALNLLRTHQDTYSAHRLTAIAHFFQSNWNQPVSESLSENDQAWLLGEATGCLKHLGRLKEAVIPRQAEIRLYQKLQAWENAVTAIDGLVDLLLPQGLLSQARYIARQAVDWAEHLHDPLKQITSHCQLATTLHRLGELVENVSGFQLAEMLQAQRYLELPFLYSQAGTQYCNLLLDRAKEVTERETVLKRGQYVLKVSEQYSNPREQALAHLILAKALAALHRPTESQTEFDTAVTLIRQAKNNLYDLPEILLARANFSRLQNHLNSAQQDLDEVLEIANGYNMWLYQAEAYLLQGHLWLDVQCDQWVTSSRMPNEALKKVEHIYQVAAKQIKDMDYGLRIAELSLLAARLAYYANRSRDALIHLETAKQRIQVVGQWGLLSQWEKISTEIC